MILGSCSRADQTVEHEDDGDMNSSWCTWIGP